MFPPSIRPRPTGRYSDFYHLAEVVSRHDLTPRLDGRRRGDADGIGSRGAAPTRRAAIPRQRERPLRPKRARCTLARPMLDDPAQHRPLTVGGLERLLETVGIGAAAAARTTICGRDPVLPSRFPLGAAAVTAPAGCGVAAARCLEVRANVTQEVRVSVPRAAALAGELHAPAARREGARRSPDPLNALFETHDGR
jgi:hypothetical protein